MDAVSCGEIRRLAAQLAQADHRSETAQLLTAIEYILSEEEGNALGIDPAKLSPFTLPTAYFTCRDETDRWGTVLRRVAPRVDTFSRTPGKRFVFKSIVVNGEPVYFSQKVLAGEGKISLKDQILVGDRAFRHPIELRNRIIEMHQSIRFHVNFLEKGEAYVNVVGLAIAP